MTESSLVPSPTAPDPTDEYQLKKLAVEVAQRAPDDAIKLLDQVSDAVIAKVLMMLGPSNALNILLRFEEDRRKTILLAGSPERREQLIRNKAYPEGSVGRLMEPPIAVFGPDLTVTQAVEQLRELVKKAFITYGYVADQDGKLLGVIVMRDLLLAAPTQRLGEIMLRQPFHLSPRMDVADAMPLVVTRHYPVYPVCDEAGRLVGLVRGYVLFQEQTIQISAQPGRMVGVESEDRLATPWRRSLRLRHAWLQLNLLTAFLAAAVVGLFEQTIQQVVILALFLPVLAGQSGNTGCQALAVTLRGMTLGELKPGAERRLVTKEAWLGCLNGVGVGVAAGVGMFITATGQHQDRPFMLAFVVFLAMVGACVASGVSGAMVPLTLKRLGFDPATASSIFLTTATDVVSMGMLLGLATMMVR